MKTTLELSKFKISIEEDEKGVVKLFVTKDGESIDEMVFDADEFTSDVDDDTEEDVEEKEEEEKSEKESDAQEVKVGECLSFDKFIENNQVNS